MSNSTMGWTELEVTWRSASAPPPDNTLSLPPGKPVHPRVVVRTPGGKELLAKTMPRSGHGGEGAVASGSLYGRLGGTDTGVSVRYRRAGIVDRLRLRPMLIVQLGVVVLTLIGALINAWAAFLRTQADPPTAFAAQTAAIVLFIAFAGAAWKFYQDFKLE